jgi:selenide,water dikinase
LTLAVNGSPGSRTFGKRGMRTGQLLILGKPLGSGIVLAAHMHQRAAGPALAAALEVMDSSPRLQAMWLAEAGVECCTDVSGFGLLGHLDELLAGTLLQVELDLAAVPLLPETRSLADAGVRSSLFTQNEARALQQGRWQALQAQPLWPILLDPQTSGGLLAAIDADYAEPATALGFSVIGRVL